MQEGKLWVDPDKIIGGYILANNIFSYAAHIWFGGSREEYCRGAVIIPADLFGANIQMCVFPAPVSRDCSISG